MQIDLTTSSGRLRWARESAGFKDQTDFARELNIKDVTYRAYENGQNGFAKHVFLFARKLGVTAEWLLEGGPAPRIDKISSECFSENSRIVEIREWDFATGVGNNSSKNLPTTGKFLSLSISSLRNFSQAEEDNLFFIRNDGDCMAPTIHYADIIIVDTSDCIICVGDKIWAIVYGGSNYIRRIRPMCDGTFKIISESKVIPVEIARHDELRVIGRVVSIMRKI